MVSLGELRHRILPAASLAPEDKIVFDWSVLDERLQEWRRNGLRIGFTNGCFDLLHRGHVKLLAEARAACDRLVVGLNSDSSTARLKGEGRPINPAKGRADVLAALEAVDLVVVFEEDTPLELSSADLELLHASLSEAFGCSLAILPSHSISQGPRERTRAFPSMKAANFQRSAPRRLQSRCAPALQVVVLRFP